MKLDDIIGAARKQSPNLELEVINSEGETVTITLRNVLAMPQEDRRRLVIESKQLDAEAKDIESGETTDDDQIGRTAKHASEFMAIVAKTPEQYGVLEWAMGLDKDIEDLAWINLFTTYAKQTQLGEASSSQTS